MSYRTVAQIAEMLAVTPDKVTDLIRTGQLAAIDISLHPGGKARWRISETDLEDFLRRRRSQPPAPAAKRKKRRDAGVTQYY